MLLFINISLGRILLGFISLYDLYYFRLKYAYSFYTDDGMWPRSLILQGKDPQAKKTDFSPYGIKFKFITQRVWKIKIRSRVYGTI